MASNTELYSFISISLDKLLDKQSDTHLHVIMLLHGISNLIWNMNFQHLSVLYGMIFTAGIMSGWPCSLPLITSHLSSWWGNLWSEHYWSINTLRPRQDGRHFPDGIFNCIFLNENGWIPMKFRWNLFNNIPALVQIMTWRCPGDKPLSESMMVSLATHICVTRPQWVNWSSAGISENISSAICENVIHSRTLASKSTIVKQETISDFAVNIVPADGLAPLGAGPSAGAMMTMCISHLCTGLVSFKWQHIYNMWLVLYHCGYEYSGIMHKGIFSSVPLDTNHLP